MHCRAYDAAAVQLLGASAVTNFNVHDVMAALPAAAQQPAEAAAAAPDQAHQDIQMPLPGAFQPLRETSCCGWLVQASPTCLICSGICFHRYI